MTVLNDGVPTGTHVGGGVYTNRARLNNMFGSENVTEWSDLDNDGDQAKIEAKIDEAIGDMSDYIDRELSHLYSVPFNPVPRLIQSIATSLVGHQLRDSRHIIEDDDVVLRKYDKAMQQLRHIKAGATELSNMRASRMAQTVSEQVSQ